MSFVYRWGLFCVLWTGMSGAYAQVTKKITIAYFSDLHAQVEEHPELFWYDNGTEEMATAGGASRMAALLERIRKENPEGTLVFDGGDSIQGSGEAALTQGSVMIPILNQLKIDAAVPGNWEVVYGVPVLKSFAQKIHYPLVAVNVFEEQKGDRVFPPYKIFERQGVKIALIGYTDPDVPTHQPPNYSKGLTYQTESLLQPFIDEIRANDKADIIILLSHIGLPKAVELSSRLKNIDLHLSGDTHERTYRPIEKNHWVVEAGAFGSFLGRMDFWVKDGKIINKNWELIELRTGRFDEEKKMKALVEKTVGPYKEKLNKVIGTTKDALLRYSINQNNLDMILADAIREATGAQIALLNGFRFGTPILPGPIRERDLWNFFPINNHLRVGKVTGAQLKDFWEREIENVYSTDPRKLFGGWLPRPSGMTVRFKVGGPIGQKVTEIRVGGEPIELEKVYTIGACAREGDPLNKLCRIPNIESPKELSIDAHGAVRQYLKKNKEVHSPPELRVIADDLPTTIRSQYYRR